MPTLDVGCLYVGVATSVVIFLLGFATNTLRIVYNPSSKVVLWVEVTWAIITGNISINENYDEQVKKQRKEYEDDE